MEREKLLSNLLDNYQVQGVKSKDQVWDHLQKEIELNQQKQQPLRLGWSFWASSAAALVLALIIVYSRIERDETINHDLLTQAGETRFMTLPDSSTITLAPNSRLFVAYNVRKSERKVTLKGEAYFAVKKGGSFIVDFDGGSVSVLGTEFSVSAYDSSFFQINCTQGLVKVNSGQKSILLNHGQGVKFQNGLLTDPYAIDEEEVKDQKLGVYYCNKMPLINLMSLIGSRFDYQVNIVDGLKDRNFSGRIELNNLDACLEIVSLAMNIEYSRDNNLRLIQLHEK
jgi:transmembrane sensor